FLTYRCQKIRRGQQTSNRSQRCPTDRQRAANCFRCRKSMRAQVQLVNRESAALRSFDPTIVPIAPSLPTLAWRLLCLLCYASRGNQSSDPRIVVAMARNNSTSNAQRDRHLRGGALASAQII